MNRATDMLELEQWRSGARRVFWRVYWPQPCCNYPLTKWRDFTSREKAKRYANGCRKLVRVTVSPEWCR